MHLQLDQMKQMSSDPLLRKITKAQLKVLRFERPPKIVWQKNSRKKIKCEGQSSQVCPE